MVGLERKRAAELKNKISLRRWTREIKIQHQVLTDNNKRFVGFVKGNLKERKQKAEQLGFKLYGRALNYNFKHPEEAEE
jgi:dihydroxyacetone kinase-like predicted kinase